jgi:hypothetical protein
MTTSRHPQDDDQDLNLFPRWPSSEFQAGGVVSVLFTSDRRVFFMHGDSQIRPASDPERNEILRHLLSWRDSTSSLNSSS